MLPFALRSCATWARLGGLLVYSGVGGIAPALCASPPSLRRPGLAGHLYLCGICVAELDFASSRSRALLRCCGRGRGLWLMQGTIRFAGIVHIIVGEDLPFGFKGPWGTPCSCHCWVRVVHCCGGARLAAVVASTLVGRFVLARVTVSVVVVAPMYRLSLAPIVRCLLLSAGAPPICASTTLWGLGNVCLFFPSGWLSWQSVIVPSFGLAGV